ncbi:DUF4493 domain-containing protein [Phocaeicola sp.]
MMKINKYIGICLIIGTGALSACQMENDLRGKNDKTDKGFLDASMLPQENESLLSRASNMTYSVEDFPVTIMNLDKKEVVASFDTYKELKEQGKIELEPGNYQVKAWYGDSIANAQRKPYFVGTDNFNIQAAKTTEVNAVCKLGGVKVTMEMTDEFMQYFAEDYSIAVNNDKGGLFFSKEETEPVFFKKYDGDKSIKVAIKATNLTTGQDIQQTYILEKPTDKDNGLLVEGDAFSIKLDTAKIEGTVTNPTLVNIGLTVDLTMTEKNETITIPVHYMDMNGDGNEGGGEGEDGDEPVADAPVLTPDIDNNEVWTLAMSKAALLTETESHSVVIKINAPKKIAALNVSIGTDVPAFEEAIAQLNLTSFNLCNITDASTQKTFDEVLAIPYNDAVKGKESFDFDISAFMGLLAMYDPGTFEFTISTTDEAGKSVSNTLIVTMGE